MKKLLFLFISLWLIVIFLFNCSTSTITTKRNFTHSSKSYYTGKYKNLFTELLNIPENEVQNKLNQIFNYFFYGNDSTERIYYPVGNDMAYIADVLHDDVRTEGMSYGMMIAVQMNKKKEFDCLWKWAKTYMQHSTPDRMGYFAWHCKTDGTKLDLNSASDGEEWFVMSLLFASAKWGDGEGIYNYKAEAQFILDNMLNKDQSNESKITNMFDKKEKMVVFVPTTDDSWFTDPSYHLPHFYELWSRWSKSNNKFWCDVAKTSREFLKKVANPVTGLMPDYSSFNGNALSPWNGGNENFQYDAWRCAMNISIDYEWFGKDEWQVEELNKILDFFYNEGIHSYGNIYTLDGKKLGNEHSIGLVAMNASGAISSTSKYKKEFIQELWNVKIPQGKYRYYDGMLYMLGMLQVSGNFRIYDPTNTIIRDCDEIK
ncbi:MAG TPA: glycosyl hydrolase family 8 [Bacteroidota bacterium]|nr:glycosyl hydrolase family 8 [Bacteroidota bacterium]